MIAYQIDIANELFKTNVLEAKAYGEQWVHAEPHSFPALHFCGIIAAKLNDMPKALEYFNRAILQDPSNVACHNNLSNVYLALNETEKALQHLHQALKVDPMHPEAYNNFGRLLYKQGRINDAIPYFQKALRIEPNYWEAHYNLAHSFASQNQMNAAATHYREVLKFFPEHPIAHFNLGLASLNEENYLESELHLSKALQLMPNNLEAAKQLGHVYVTLGKIEEAIQTLELCLQLSPNLAEVHHNLAILVLRNQERTRALKHFQEALRLDPTNDTAKHMVMALSGSQTSSTSPPNYVTQLFDQYADYYDEHVKQKLKYTVPGLLRNAVAKALTKTGLKTGRLLDLGCGTGQCGIYFRDLAIDMVGIDLSERMIEKARNLEVYEKLQVVDMDNYLKQPDLEPFDFIIAGDVLVYKGDLDILFKGVLNVLLPTGLFAFTTETIPETLSRDFYLQPTGRYAHTPNYIHRLAQQYGFTIEYEEDIIPREHEGESIPGRLYVLRHP